MPQSCCLHTGLHTELTAISRSTSTSLCNKRGMQQRARKSNRVKKNKSQNDKHFFNFKHRTPFIYATKLQIWSQMKYTATLRACLASIRSQDSPFGIVTRLRATHREIVSRFVAQARNFSLLQSDQTDYGAGLVSYSIITRVKPTTKLQLVSMLRKSAAVPQQPHMHLWRAQEYLPLVSITTHGGSKFLITGTDMVLKSQSHTAVWADCVAKLVTYIHLILLLHFQNSLNLPRSERAGDD